MERYVCSAHLRGGVRTSNVGGGTDREVQGYRGSTYCMLYHTACFALLTALKSLRHAWLQKHKIRRRQCEGAHGRLSVGVYDIHRVQKLQA